MYVICQIYKIEFTNNHSAGSPRLKIKQKTQIDWTLHSFTLIIHTQLIWVAPILNLWTKIDLNTFKLTYFDRLSSSHSHLKVLLFKLRHHVCKQYFFLLFKGLNLFWVSKNIEKSKHVKLRGEVIPAKNWEMFCFDTDIGRLRSFSAKKLNLSCTCVGCIVNIGRDSAFLRLRYVIRKSSLLV